MPLGGHLDYWDFDLDNPSKENEGNFSPLLWSIGDAVLKEYF